MTFPREYLDIVDESQVPKHIIIIPIDACRYEYLKQFSFPNIEFLISNGVSFANAIAANCVAETAPGFASISTGKYMKDHGISSSDSWYDRESKKLFYFYDEETGELRLDSPTLVDIVKQKKPSVKVASISAKDRNSFLLGGNSADIVVFSYREKMSQRSDFSGKGVRSDAFGWTERPGKELPSYLADLTIPRVVDWEGPGFHHPNENSANTPFMDKFIMEGALKILEHEKPDILFVSLLSANIVGHIYLTESNEIKNTMEITDKQIGKMISRVKEMGWFDDTLFVITADHGMADKPYSIDLMGELKRKAPKRLVENIAYRYMVPTVGGLYLHDVKPDLIDETIKALTAIDHVKEAWYKNDPKAPWYIQRGAHKRSPDIIVVPEFEYQIAAEGSVEPVYPAYHGAPYYADFSILMVFSGCGVKKMGTIGEHNIPREAYLTDEMVRDLPDQTQIVPTIMRILKIAA
jgi:predicted AlkP superfamily pyrophosphatase or phosphodiesterase